MIRLPKKLKHFNYYDDGNEYRGQVDEIELPKFARKMEELRTGGMFMPIEVDLGAEKLEMTVTMAGFVFETFKNYASSKHNTVVARFVGSYSADDSCDTYAMEIEVNGRYKEIELGKAKSGDETTHKIVLALSYIKIIYNGQELCEVDAINMIDKWMGKDRLEEHRRNVGA